MGTAIRIPVSRAWRIVVTTRARRSLVAGELGPEGLHERRRPGSRDAEELLDVAAREQLAVQRRELADGVGDGEQPAGRGGHRVAPCRLQPLRRVRVGKMSGAHPMRYVFPIACLAAPRLTLAAQDYGGYTGYFRGVVLPEWEQPCGQFTEKIRRSGGNFLPSSPQT